MMSKKPEMYRYRLIDKSAPWLTTGAVRSASYTGDEAIPQVRRATHA